MDNELAGLPDEVREAVGEMNALPKAFPEIALKRPIFMEGMMSRWGFLQTELLRLACENAELRHLPERICELRDAEAERDALRKRIDESRHVTIGSYPAHGFGYVQMICDPAKGISDKVYALVPLDDAEAAP